MAMKTLVAFGDLQIMMFRSKSFPLKSSTISSNLCQSFASSACARPDASCLIIWISTGVLGSSWSLSKVSLVVPDDASRGKVMVFFRGEGKD